MKLILTRISKQDYVKCKYPVLFGDEISDRSFAIILHGALYSKFSWQSDTIDPKIIKINDQSFCIGIDLNFSIVNIISGLSYVSLQLNYFFYKVILRENKIFVITELEVILINKETYQVINQIDLPDFFAGIKFSNDAMEILCMNGETIIHNKNSSI